MPRLIFKCLHMKPGARKTRGGFAKYIATRDGVEKLPTHGREGYAEYMAARPESHGLFGAGDAPLKLSEVMDEISSHPGNIWTPIVSLKRDDAVRFGFDNAERWRQLAMAHAGDIAKALKINPKNFVWYGAYHNEPEHPHMHIVCYSKEPREGFLTEKGIGNIKSILARDIFRNALQDIYELQTQTRQETGDAARETLQQMLQEIQADVLSNANVAGLMAQLVDKLETHKGKMVYGYLRPPAKEIVNAIVDELAKVPQVAEVYEKWWNLRQEVIGTYADAPVERVPLSQNDTFKQVRNMVVKEAAAILEADVRSGIDMRTSEQAVGMDSIGDFTTAVPVPGALADASESVGAEYMEPHPYGDDHYAAPSVLNASARLLHGLVKIFETTPIYTKTPHQHMDRKRKQQLQQQHDGKGIEIAEHQQNAPIY